MHFSQGHCRWTMEVLRHVIWGVDADPEAFLEAERLSTENVKRVAGNDKLCLNCHSAECGFKWARTSRSAFSSEAWQVNLSEVRFRQVQTGSCFVTNYWHRGCWTADMPAKVGDTTVPPGGYKAHRQCPTVTPGQRYGYRMLSRQGAMRVLPKGDAM